MNVLSTNLRHRKSKQEEKKEKKRRFIPQRGEIKGRAKGEGKNQQDHIPITQTFDGFPCREYYIHFYLISNVLSTPSRLYPPSFQKPF